MAGYIFDCFIKNREIIIDLLNVFILAIAAYFAYKIGKKQNEINQNILNLNFFPSLEVVYDPSSSKINILNKGRANIYLWGTKMGNGKEIIENIPREVTSGGFYYLNAKDLEKNILSNIDNNLSKKSLNLTIYFETQDRKLHKLNTTLIFNISEGKINSVNAQSFPVADWQGRNLS